ncbi:MAG: ribonuclease R, partial [Myxococcota bacterium]
VSVSVGFADKRGRTFVAVGERRNDCERYNEQISLLCNIKGAEYLQAATEAAHVLIRPVFRVHPAPDPPRYDQLAKTIKYIARHHKLDPAVWHWRWRGDDAEGESLADYLERLPRDGDARGVYLAIQRQALLINNRSLFDGAPGLHHGVGAAIYARFSSPMREVVGIFTHKEALEGLAGIDDAPEDEAIHAAVILAANRSKQTQRKVTKQSNQLVLDEFLAADVALPLAERPAHPGVIIGAENGKLYVQLESPPLEVKVYLPLVARCLDARADTRGRGKGALERGDERVAWYLGDTLSLTVHHQEANGHWCLVPDRVLSWVEP